MSKVGRRLHLFQGLQHCDAHDAHAFIVNLADLFGSRDLDRVRRMEYPR